MAYEKFDESDDEASDNANANANAEIKQEKSVKDDGTEQGEAKAQAQAEVDQGGKRKRKRKRKKNKKDDDDDDDDDKEKAKEDNDNGGNDNGANSTVNKLESLPHTIFVEGIPFEYKEDDVKEFFVKYGCDDILQVRLPTWQDTGRLRGFGHIVFDTTESRNKALTELNGKNLGRRYITIQEAKDKGSGSGSAGSRGQPRPQPEGCRTVFVRNLPYRDITEDDVQQVFRSCGKIVEGGVRLTRNYQTKELKGFGYIEFKNPEGAYSAVQRGAKGTLKVGQRACYVDYDAGGRGPKGSFRNKDGKNWQKEHGGDSNNSNSRERKRFRSY